MLPALRSPLSRRLAVLTPVVLLVSACSGAASQSAAPPSAAPSAAASVSGSGTSVTATESEFKIELSATSATAGPVTFAITNSGTVVHEFVVVKTDLASDKLPVDSSTGEVKEDDPSITPIDEVEDIAVGANESLSVDLPAGHYVLFCNVTGHYGGGMHTDFTTN